MYNFDFRDFLDLDWTEKPYILFLVFLFVLSRIPLLNLGFGSDPDAWRIANSAFDLYHFHIYHPSRFPSYPVPELFNALIINFGWLATNTFTMILSLISVIVFAKILKELNIKNKGLLVITYAFIPILWIQSTSTMDYMWALTFILLTWFFIIRKQYILAGLMMGLAIGSRMTSAALILPFIYLVWIENKHAKNVIYYLIITLIVPLILFLPLFLQYNLDFLTYYPVNVDIITIWQDFNYCFGTLAVAFGLMLFMISFKSLWKNILKKDHFTLFLLFSIAMVVILFIKAPIQITYIIPAIPFALVLMNNISKKKFFAIFCFLLILNSSVSFASADISHIVDDGVILDNIESRTALLHSTQIILDNDNKNSVIMVGEYLPSLCYLYEESARNPKIIGMVGFNQFETREHFNSEKNVRYIYLASLDQILALQEKNIKIYYGGNKTLNLNECIYGYNLNNYNCSNILI